MITKPYFRQDLVTTREEEQGVVYYHLKDTTNNSQFRLYEMEYMIAQMFNGESDLNTIMQAIRDELHFEMTADDLTRFINQLDSMNFLDKELSGHEEPTLTPPPADDNDFLPTDKLDPQEEKRMITNATLQIKQGFFGHARDYFLSLKEANPNDQRHIAMLNHLSIVGEEPSESDMTYIWEQIRKLYPEIADIIGAPQSQAPDSSNKEKKNKEEESRFFKSNKHTMLILAIVLAILAAIGVGLYFILPEFLQPAATVKATEPVSWEKPLLNQEITTEISLNKTANLAFPIKGIIDSVAVQPEEQVTKGTLLASLKLSDSAKKPLDKAHLTAQTAEQNLNNVEQSILRNNERLETLTEKKKAAMETIKELASSKKSKDRATIQNLKKQLVKINKELAAGQKLKSKLDKELTVAKKEDYQARAALDDLLKKSTYRKSSLLAPFDGVITDINIKANGATNKKTAMVLVDPTQINFTFTMKPAMAAGYKDNQGVSILHKVDDGFTKLPGTITKIIPTEGKIIVRVIDINGTLYKEEAANFNLIIETTDKLWTIPDAAVKQNGSGYYVWVVTQDSVARRRTIKPVQIMDGVQLFSGEFSHSDRIITGFADPATKLELTELMPVSVLP